MPFHGFKGDRKGKAAKTGGFSQATLRHEVFCFDQHGRRFAFPAENNTGFPCGIIVPCFTAPFLPDPQYRIVNPDNTSELYLDYRTMIKDRIGAMREYHAKAVRKAEKATWPAPVMGDYTEEIIDACGKPPRAYQLAVAADQGNPWVLGETERVDPRLVKFLETASREIDEVIEHYDFGADSYLDAVAQNVRHAHSERAAPVATAPKRFKSLKELASLAPASTAPAIDLNDPAAVAAEYFADDDELNAVEFDDENDTAEFDDLIDNGSGDDVDDELFDNALDEPDYPGEFEDLVDRDAIGGKTVNPQAERQSPDKPKGKKPKAFTRGRKSMADGARPIVGN